ncbi:MAG: DNA gyrase inhibitor YacG [Pontibacterium sp.]
MSKKTVACPQCKKPALWSEDNAFRPFCSERCRLIDLGAWASEAYQIASSGNEDENDYSTGDEPGARDVTPTMH